MSRIPTNLTEKTSRGFFWTTGFTLIGKIVSMLCQVALAALLMEEAFGLVAMTGIVRAVAFLLANPGIGTILIQRGNRFNRWANPAFWLTLAGGIIASLLMLATAPLFARLYGEPTLAGMIAVLAIAPPINAFAVPAEARIRRDLRFRLLGFVNFCRSSLQLILAVGFAALGFGAYSFVIPVPITFLIIAVLVNYHARWPIRFRPQFRRWRYMLRDARNLFSSQAIVSVANQADYAIIGLFHAAGAVGIYFFAYNLSLQAFYLLAANIAGVLMPSLSRLTDEPERQRAAFLRASRAVATVLVPACILQAALADFGIRLLFEPRWYSAIPILQILSLGWAFRCLTAPSISLLQAKGRYGTELILRLVTASLLLFMVTAAAKWGDVLAVAIAVSLHSALFMGPTFLYVALRPGDSAMKLAWSTLTGPLLLSLLAVLPPTVIAYYTPRFPGYNIYAILIVTIGMGAGYMLYLNRFMPEVYREILSHVPSASLKRFLSQTRQ